MKKIVKIKTTFKQLFENYFNSKNINEVVKSKVKMFIKNSNGELEEIIGMIKKDNHDIFTHTFSNGLQFNCSDKHIIKIDIGFEFLKNLTIQDNILLYNSSPIKLIKRKLYKKNSFVYDLALKVTHEYVTPNGLIHHNTTLARILTSKEGVLHNRRDNLLTVNGSAQTTRGIGYVEKVIEPFLKIPPANDKYKVVFIDEADNLTPDSYKSLRGIIEKYQVHYGRFILTCNYVSVIPEPVRSRFTQYIFKQIPQEFAVSYAQKILLAENIEYIEKDVMFLVEQLYPDIRQIIDSLQKNSKKTPKDKSKAGCLDVNEGNITTNEKKIIGNILEVVSCIISGQDKKIGRPVSNIVEILKSEDLEYRGLYTQLFYMQKFPAPAKIIVNKYSNSHNSSLVPAMHFMAMVFEITRSLQEYKKAMVNK